MATNISSKLPFVEQYRPKTLNDIIAHQNIIATLRTSIATLNVPHLLFYGPPGTGKTSTIEAFVHDLYGEENVEFMTMNINASEERGIEIVRNKITNFAKTMPIFIKHSEGKNIPKYKFVILDEADAMTLDAQATLRKVMEVYTYNARFCLVCNYIKGIDEPIKSRCATFKFRQLRCVDATPQIINISKKNNITVTNDGIFMMWKLSNGDMRKLLHNIQILAISNKFIDENIVSKCQKYPTQREINELYDILTKKSFNFALKYMRQFLFGRHYSIADILAELTDIVIHDSIEGVSTSQYTCYVLKSLSEIEMNLIVTIEIDIQLCGLVGVFNIAQKIDK